MEELKRLEWGGESGELLSDRQFTYSIATLNRTLTLVAMGLGWFMGVTSAPPFALVVSVGLVCACLACVVGWRRFGSLFVKCGAGVLFLGGSVMLAVYSGVVACTVQSMLTSDPWDDGGGIVFAISTFAALPIVSVVLVYMVRAWTWSANDVAIYARR